MTGAAFDDPEYNMVPGSVPQQPADFSRGEALHPAAQALTRALAPAREAWRALTPRAGGPEGVGLIVGKMQKFPVLNACGKPLTPTTQLSRTTFYEWAILRDAQLSIRSEGWHDWFNLLTWHHWPLSKAALNLRNVLQYLGQLEHLYADQGLSQVGRTVPRDVWMQTVAMLDEGGCVATTELLATQAELDARRVYTWKPGCTAQDIQRGLRWFGHAALETLQLQAHALKAARAGAPKVSTPRQPETVSLSHERQVDVPPVSQIRRQSQGAEGLEPSRFPPLRMFVVEVPRLDDAVLAQRILTFHPSLETLLQTHRRSLETLGISVLPVLAEMLRIDEADPFLKPARSVLDPWTSPLQSP